MVAITNWTGATPAQAVRTEPRREGFWTAKPRNWRTRYGYKPPSFRTHVAPRLDTSAAYRNWLANELAGFEPRYVPVVVPPRPRVYVVTPTREQDPVAVPEAARRRDAAALLRELAGKYGPRRADKLRAMADFIETPLTAVTIAKGV